MEKPICNSPFNFLGMELADLTPQLAKILGIKNDSGVVIKNLDPASPAAQAGLSIGDIILSVNIKEVRSAAEVKTRINQLPEGSRLLLFMRRGERTFYVALAR